MPDAERPLLSGLKSELGAAAAELRQLAALRLELARLEARQAAAAAKRLAIAGAGAGLMAICALPVLVVCAAHGLARWPGGLGAAGWMLAIGLVLLAGAGLGGWLAWRRFRREWSGFEESLEELREDLVWLREWAGRGGEPGADDAP